MKKDRRELSPRELARRACVSTDTLRHYEKKGLLAAPPRTRSGYRRYPPEALTRVLLIRRALRLGFSLDALAGILTERERGGAPCRKVHAAVRERLAAVGEEIRALRELEKELRRLLRDWEARLATTPEGVQARLLDDLDLEVASNGMSTTRRSRVAGTVASRSSPGSFDPLTLGPTPANSAAIQELHDVEKP